jgi:hypothetical protein
MYISIKTCKKSWVFSRIPRNTIKSAPGWRHRAWSGVAQRAREVGKPKERRGRTPLSVQEALVRGSQHAGRSECAGASAAVSEAARTESYFTLPRPPLRNEKATAMGPMAFEASMSVTSRTGRSRHGSTSPTPGMAEAGARGFGCSSVVGASCSLRLHTLVRRSPS